MRNAIHPMHRCIHGTFFLILFLCTAGWGQVSVLTQHGDNARTGENTAESILTPANVATNFGKLFTRSMDANVNGQVLYVPNVTINSAKHNVLIAYTSNNSNGSACSLYAFDADDPAASAPLWHHTFTNSAQWTTDTPVIDSVNNIIYLVTKDNNDSGPTNLRALSLLTGAELTGSPILVAASVTGNGDGSSGGIVSFDTSHANCRPGLLLLNGTIYIAFAHNSDSFPYHGWVFGYQYNGTAFTQTSVFCTNPNGGLDGIWMAGNGIAADTAGNLYVTVANGTFDIPSSGTSYGMSILKLATPALTVSDWFCPFDELGLSNGDQDTGNCGVIGIPGTDRLFAGGTKFGSAFLVDSSNLGHFTAGGPDNILDRINGLASNVGQNPVSWDGGAFKYVYLWGNGNNIEQFRYDPTPATFNPAGAYKTGTANNGGSMAVSSNGASSGILWAVGNNAVVHAINATDVSQPDYWNSSTNSARDGLGSVGHFQFPTVANGKVYVGTGSSTIVAYGLLGVQGGTTTHFTLTGPSSTVAGTGFNITTTAKDVNGNTVTTYGGTVHYTTTDHQGSVPTNTTLTNGVKTAKVDLRTAGTQSFTGTDTVTPSITGTSSSISVSPGNPQSFLFSTPATATLGTGFTFTLTVKDGFGNTVPTYAGTVHFTSTDPTAVLPSDFQLTNGTGTFSATFHTAGKQRITATDTVKTTIKGTSQIITAK